jgi:hypothetical protein
MILLFINKNFKFTKQSALKENLHILRNIKKYVMICISLSPFLPAGGQRTAQVLLPSAGTDPGECIDFHLSEMELSDGRHVRSVDIDIVHDFTHFIVDSSQETPVGN